MVDAMVKPLGDDNGPNQPVPSDFHGAGTRYVPPLGRCAASPGGARLAVCRAPCETELVQI
jgi:hypothetical protein